jgi:hypothetical protein
MSACRVEPGAPRNEGLLEMVLAARRAAEVMSQRGAVSKAARTVARMASVAPPPGLVAWLKGQPRSHVVAGGQSCFSAGRLTAGAPGAWCLFRA